MSEPIIRDQTFTFGGVHYRAGRPIPEEVAREHGLIREGSPSKGDSSRKEPAEDTPLPEDFPARDLLAEAGFETIEAIAGAEDDELLAVDGIGPARLEEIRTATA